MPSSFHSHAEGQQHQHSRERLQATPLLYLQLLPPSLSPQLVSSKCNICKTMQSRAKSYTIFFMWLLATVMCVCMFSSVPALFEYFIDLLQQLRWFWLVDGSPLLGSTHTNVHSAMCCIGLWKEDWMPLTLKPSLESAAKQARSTHPSLILCQNCFVTFTNGQHVQAKEFHMHICLYNSTLAFTSTRGPQHLLGSSFNGCGPPHYKIHGEIVHWLGPVQPSRQGCPCFLSTKDIWPMMPCSFAKVWICNMTCHKGETAIYTGRLSPFHRHVHAGLLTHAANYIDRVPPNWTFIMVLTAVTTNFLLLMMNPPSSFPVMRMQWPMCSKFCCGHKEVHWYALASMIIATWCCTFLCSCQLASKVGNWILCTCLAQSTLPDMSLSETMWNFDFIPVLCTYGPLQSSLDSHGCAKIRNNRRQSYIRA